MKAPNQENQFLGQYLSLGPLNMKQECYPLIHDVHLKFKDLKGPLTVRRMSGSQSQAVLACFLIGTSSDGKGNSSITCKIR
jgi:hypothetical protein